MSISNISTQESAQLAARRFSENIIPQGYKPQSLHEYADASGKVIYYRIRLKHLNGQKWIRPMHQDSNGLYQLGEPPEFKGALKPLYRLDLVSQYPEVAYGGTFLSFNAPKPCRVLYIDGEMPANTMQERLARIDKRMESNRYLLRLICNLSLCPI